MSVEALFEALDSEDGLIDGITETRPMVWVQFGFDRYLLLFDGCQPTHYSRSFRNSVALGLTVPVIEKIAEALHQLE